MVTWNNLDKLASFEVIDFHRVIGESYRCCMPADIYFLSSIQFAGNPIPEEVLGIFFQVCMIQVDPIIGEYKLRSFRRYRSTG